jgi:lipoprotein-anchoring transpeptidase ErfK/SrfK
VSRRPVQQWHASAAASTSLAAALSLCLGACGGSGREATEAPYYPRAEAPISRPSVAPRPPAAAVRRPAATDRPTAASRCDSTKARPMRTRSVAFAAVVRSTTAAHTRPGGEIIERFGALNANLVPTAFGVLGRTRCGWLRVQLPTRRNGGLGWIRARDVRLVRVRTRISVDLSGRRVTLYRDGREVLRAEAAIGAGDTPTPVGSFYVNQRLIAADPAGPFGPAAIGISAFSPVLQHWLQGGPIAIHGTNRPDLLGGAVSHGCIRVRNDLLVRLFRLADVGTPVLIGD